VFDQFREKLGLMSNYDAVASVREFFGGVGYAGLILPTGWFGRPYDNLLTLTRSEAAPKSLLLELDDQLILSFSGDVQVRASEKGIQLRGYTSLVFEWTEFGSNASHRDEFVSGTIEFATWMS
jgi:hypothetical protein